MNHHRNAARGRRAALHLLFALLLASASVRELAAQADAREPIVGPRNGTLIVAGGGRLGPEIMDRFLELAGGPNARIVILPTAGEQDTFPPEWSGYSPFRQAGVRSVTVLHTRDPKVADSEAFVQPLRDATGVWISGGRQWRLADVYLDTRTLRELHALLDRGGVIGGTSAGASIQASYMVRGAVETNSIVMAEGHERGFGFLRNTAVDQHLLARGRENDLLQVIERYPELLGIGLDEGTAIVVRGDRAEVIGRSKVAFYNTRDTDGDSYYFLSAGAVFDLAERRVRLGERIPARAIPAEREVIAAVRALFDAMRAADTVRVRAAFHPDARLFVSAETSGRAALRASDVSAFVRSVGASAQRLDERFRDPDVRIDGNLATVWTFYEFYRGDQLSHCGTDVFQLAKDDAGWKILQIAYTIRQQPCRR